MEISNQDLEKQVALAYNEAMEKPGARHFDAKIAAILRHRQLTGSGLAEAKNYVEERF